MKKNFLILVLLLISYSAGYSGVIYYDDPLAVGIGARPTGMGRAFVAIADDCNAIFMNPGGLGMQKQWGFSSMSTRFMDEYQYTMLSGVYPTENGVFGLGYVSSSIGDITLTGGETATFMNQALVLSYSNDVSGYLEPLLGKGRLITGGVNLKYYSKGFSGDLRESGSGMNVDSGLKWQFDPAWSFGLAFQNNLPGAKIGGDFEPEDMPFVTKLGAAYYWSEYRLRFALDKDMFFGREVPWPAHFGVEWKAHNNLTLRTGFDQVAGAADGGNIATNTTFGVGLQYSGFTVDLAYVKNFSETDVSSTFISISLFGDLLAAKKKAEERKAPEPVPAAEEKPVTPPKAEEKIIPAPAPTVTATPEAAVIPTEEVKAIIESIVGAIPITQKIRILSPQPKSYTFDWQVEISGNVDPEINEIWINGISVPIDDQGGFSQLMPLEYGKNFFNVSIKDFAGNEGSTSVSIARYYIPENMTKEEAEKQYFDYVVIQSKLRDYLGEDYSTTDNISRETLMKILTKMRESQGRE